MCSDPHCVCSHVHIVSREHRHSCAWAHTHTQCTHPAPAPQLHVVTPWRNRRAALPPATLKPRSAPGPLLLPGPRPSMWDPQQRPGQRPQQAQLPNLGRKHSCHSPVGCGGLGGPSPPDGADRLGQRGLPPQPVSPPGLHPEYLPGCWRPDALGPTAEGPQSYRSALPTGPPLPPVAPACGSSWAGSHPQQGQQELPSSLSTQETGYICNFLKAWSQHSKWGCFSSGNCNVSPDPFLLAHSTDTPTPPPRVSRCPRAQGPCWPSSCPPSWWPCPVPALPLHTP